MLMSQQNTRKVERLVIYCARQLFSRRTRFEAVFEHGHWWLTEPGTGGIWDAVDTDGPLPFAFEVITEPDTE